MPIDIPPEAQILLCCARTCMDRENADRMRSLFRKKIDWTYLLELSRRHAMRPLLYWHLNNTCPEAVPQPIRSTLRQQFLKNAKRNLFLSGELRKILKSLERLKIQAIPFKGAVLAASIYGNLALRQFDDLDLLIKKSDISKAKEFFLSHEFVMQFCVAPEQEKSHSQAQCQYSFIHENGVTVGLHWGITPRFFSFPLDPELLWERLERVALGGDTVPNFAPEDLLLILCVHGGKHLWERLGWICDVAELLRAHNEMDWSRVMDQACRLRSSRMLLLGLFLARDLLGAALPEPLSKRVQADGSLVPLARQVCERIFQGSIDPRSVTETWIFHLKLRERWQDKTRYCFRYALVPTAGDWTFLQVPESLSFFHYLARPVRVAAKYGFGLCRRVFPTTDH